MTIVNLTNCTEKIRKDYESYMYFQVWHNQVNTGNYVLLFVSNILDARTNVENYNNAEEIIKHCKLNNIPCSGVMVHHSKGCYFHSI